MSCKEGILKKLVKIIGIMVVLGIGIVLTTMKVQDSKKPIQEYLAEDLVGESQEIPEENNNQASKILSTNDTKDEINANSNDTKDEINANSNDIKVSSSEINTNTTEIEVSANGIEDNTNRLNNARDQNTNNETIEDESVAVAAALNITNPSIEIDASSAILLDGKTGKVLYYKNATTEIYPASTTKLMTALVALDLCDVSEEVVIGSEINSIASDASRAYLVEGQRLTLQMLLEAMLVPSGNDAAYAIAAYVGRKSLQDNKADVKVAVQEFIRLMNEKNALLRLLDTNFKNPDGYDEEGQHTTAYDMGIIAIEALKNDTISTISRKAHARNVLLSGEDVTWNSSNKLIVSGSGMYYKYAIGLKTGTSSLAGRCLISAAEKDDCTYVSVVMNSSAVGRWEDSIALLEYGINE